MSSGGELHPPPDSLAAVRVPLGTRVPLASVMKPSSDSQDVKSQADDHGFPPAGRAACARLAGAVTMVESGGPAIAPAVQEQASGGHAVALLEFTL